MAELISAERFLDRWQNYRYQSQPVAAGSGRCMPPSLPWRSSGTGAVHQLLQRGAGQGRTRQRFCLIFGILHSGTDSSLSG